MNMNLLSVVTPPYIYHNTNSYIHDSTVSTKISLAHNILSSVHTQYAVHIPHCVKNDSPPQSNIQSPPTGVTPEKHYMERNNPPKQVPHVPNDPDAYPILLYYSSS